MKKLLAIALLMFSSAVSANSLIIASTDENGALRSNDGTVVIKVSVDKPFKLSIDEEKITESAEGVTTSYTLLNVDRGTHTVRLQTEDGVEELTVHVLRVHK